MANSIGNQIRPVGQNPFSSAGQAAFTAGCREVCKVIDAGKDGLDEVRCGFRILNCYISGFVIEIF
ncbi:hypothetical protein V466_27270 [Pseudomonas mandelii PD30]|uniref:Uncharacterized protein n=1 Tax=Pseudomonas mandelii PD30 TaxID=1419583 RepID=A0A059KUV1_9PSED|nr:hypothetical protein V466_27270 [Pseudomonas mandelii PD30]